MLDALATQANNQLGIVAGSYKTLPDVFWDLYRNEVHRCGRPFLANSTAEESITYYVKIYAPIVFVQASILFLLVRE